MAREQSACVNKYFFVESGSIFSVCVHFTNYKEKLASPLLCHCTTVKYAKMYKKSENDHVILIVKIH